MGPGGGAATGRTRGRVALNGFALIYDYEQERNGAITYSGHGVFTFDPKAGIHTLHWFDSMGSPPERFTGKFDGDRLTVAHGGPGMHARMTHDYSQPDRVAQSMEMSPDGVTWRRLFDGKYRRNLVGPKPESQVLSPE